MRGIIALANLWFFTSLIQVSSPRWDMQLTSMFKPFRVLCAGTDVTGNRVGGA
ncbi:hypothetical protein M404DRAFT_1008075 [Pisolithus tinctorius Marx 270]|uniref:Uncharacterized protein n=1 Tax=Pisolithus tinctorius Marx 270 TaxID=870435 RepID=A0A0C3NGZ4_PISTI|nr:hypothetical protein M404DRAFT_1008075 [Pisolithus tinctorius Marx 270]